MFKLFKLFSLNIYIIPRESIVKFLIWKGYYVFFFLKGIFFLENIIYLNKGNFNIIFLVKKARKFSVLKKT